MKPTVLLVVAAVLAVALAGWAWASWRAPALPGYEVQQRPLVQTVVATGRVVASSRAQVGSAITAVVAERRVQEGDRVQPGDVLAVLRADDLEAALREAEASLARLQQSTRPQAQASLREAEARLAQARRETTRRRELADRQLVARETLEQAVQAETAARAAAEQARLAARALGTGNPEEAAARARVASARAQLDKTLVRAEVAGTVLVRNVEPGDLVQPGRVPPRCWCRWTRRTWAYCASASRRSAWPMPIRHNRSPRGSPSSPRAWTPNAGRSTSAWRWTPCRNSCGRT